MKEKERRREEEETEVEKKFGKLKMSGSLEAETSLRKRTSKMAGREREKATEKEGGKRVSFRADDDNGNTKDNDDNNKEDDAHNADDNDVELWSTSSISNFKYPDPSSRHPASASAFSAP